MSIRGLRTAMLGVGAVVLPVLLAVVSYLLTAGSLGASSGRLPEERPSVATPHSPHVGSTFGPTTRITASPAAGNGSSSEGPPASQESGGTGSGGVPSSPSESGRPEDDHPEDEDGGDD